MRLTLTPTHARVELSALEKIGALRGDLSIPRERILEASVDPEPLRSIRGRLKVGLRVPGRLFVCHTGGWRQFWAIRRGTPAVRLRLDETARLREVTVSADDAEALVARLTGAG